MTYPVVTEIPAVLDLLWEARVDFIVIGGVAANAHGSARVTYDIDILYSRDDANLARIARAFQPLQPYLRGAPPGLPFEWSVATLRTGLNFALKTTLGSIDILGEVAGVGRYDDARAHATPMRLTAHDALVLDLDLLIKSKRAAGRTKDLEPLAELELLRDLRPDSVALAPHGPDQPDSRDQPDPIR